VAVKQLKIRAKDGFDRVFKVSDRTWSGTSPSLSSNPAALPGSSRLETVVSPKHLAFVGGFRVQEPPIFPHHLGVDA